MISPPLTLAVMLATLYGALAHLIFGGDGRRIALNTAVSGLGFGLGEAVGQIMSITAGSIGPMHALTATAGAWIALATLAFLSRWRKT